MEHPTLPSLVGFEFLIRVLALDHYDIAATDLGLDFDLVLATVSTCIQKRVSLDQNYLMDIAFVPFQLANLGLDCSQAPFSDGVDVGDI